MTKLAKMATTVVAVLTLTVLLFTTPRSSAEVLRRQQKHFPQAELRLLRQLEKLKIESNPAENHPYLWAWKSFAEANRPTHVSEPNGGSLAEWETWASDAETFPDCPDPLNPPAWPGYTYRDKLLKKSQLLAQEPANVDWYTMQDGVPTITAVVEYGEDVRRNRASFDYIVDNGLYYTEGLAAAFEQANEAVNQVVINENGNTARAVQAVSETVKFPAKSVEVKGDWVPLVDIPVGQRGDYYQSWAIPDDGSTKVPRRYALVALHIMTKDLPQWFWATWMNKNVLGRCDYYGCRDDFGMEPSFTAPNEEANYPYESGKVTWELKVLLSVYGLDQVFQNYRLVGAQTSFTDVTGNPTLLSNTITEQYQIQTASCITCHSRAAVDSTGATLSVFSETASSETPPNGDRLVTDNGVPDPSWFWNMTSSYNFFSSNTQVTSLGALQIDFIWGVINANSSNCSD